MIPALLISAATVGILGIVYFFTNLKRSKVDCSFCSISGSYIGVHSLVKVSDARLNELLKCDKKIESRIMNQNDRILRDIFNLDGGSNAKFNYLAKQKLAKIENKGDSDNSGLSK